MNREFLIQALSDFGLKNTFHVELLERYYDKVIMKNRVMNLTAITEEREFVIKHICDSVSPLLFLNIDRKKCIDVGTGAGFPGIPLKILESSIEMDYVESIGKKANFVKETIVDLGLEGNVFAKRAEEVARDNRLRESYDIVFTRAVSGLSPLMEFCVPLLKVNGILVSYKGPQPQDEISMAENAVNALKCRLNGVYEYVLPYTDIKHTLVVVEKMDKTPNIYPRPTQKIVKNPL